MLYSSRLEGESETKLKQVRVSKLVGRDRWCGEMKLRGRDLALRDSSDKWSD